MFQDINTRAAGGPRQSIRAYRDLGSWRLGVIVRGGPSAPQYIAMCRFRFLLRAVLNGLNINRVFGGNFSGFSRGVGLYRTSHRQITIGKCYISKRRKVRPMEYLPLLRRSVRSRRLYYSRITPSTASIFARVPLFINIEMAETIKTLANCYAEVRDYVCIGKKRKRRK